MNDEELEKIAKCMAKMEEKLKETNDRSPLNIFKIGYEMYLDRITNEKEDDKKSKEKEFVPDEFCSNRPGCQCASCAYDYGQFNPHKNDWK